MTITPTSNPQDTYSRSAARFAGDGLEVRASALGRCRRALWYAATERAITNPTDPDTLTMFDAGDALEPVVVRAMQRAGWTVTPIDRDAPSSVSVRVDNRLTVTGHPDATGSLPADGGVASEVEQFLFGGSDVEPGPDDPAEELVIEIKTRGPEAFKRWQTLGAERSHPESVAQAACYTLGLFPETRDVVIATLDTGSRRWDYEVIPEERALAAWEQAAERLTALANHHAANGPDPMALPERDFAASSWQCRTCPYLNVCLPGNAPDADPPHEEDPVEPVSDEAAREALITYEQAASELKVLDADKRSALTTLRHWLQQKGGQKATLEGLAKRRTIGMVTSRRYSVDHKRLNVLVDPKTRAEIVTERTSSYVRIS